MTKHWFAAAAAVVFVVPASASIITIGSSAARTCYEAADSSVLPARDALVTCDQALAEEVLTFEDKLATHVNRGIVRLRRGDIEAAIHDFDRAIQMDPDQPEAYLNKGVALFQRSDSASAVQLFTVALEHNTVRPAIAHFGRAVANETLGNIRAAYDDYRRASELAPEWSDPQIELQRFKVVSR